MSFWKKLASWASKMEEESTRRKVPSKHRPLSHAEFHNTLDAFGGELGKMIEMSGHLVVQHVSTCVSDLTRVAKDIVDDGACKLQGWMEATFKLYEASIGSYFATFNEASEIRHREAEDRAAKRQNHVMNGLIGVAKQMGSTELNQGERYLELMERIRVLEMDNDEKHRVMFNTMIALFENLTEQIQKKQRVVVEYREEPTLEWLVDRADEIIDFADALKAIRDNTIPPDAATMKAVRCVRGMMQVSIHDIQELLKARTQQWQLAA